MELHIWNYRWTYDHGMFKLGRLERIKKEFLIDRSVFKYEGVYVVNVVTKKNTMNKKVIIIK